MSYTGKSITIQNGSLALPTVDLRTAYANNGFGYAVTDPEQLINPGPIKKKRIAVASPVVHGSFQVNSVRDQSTGVMTILVLGTDHNDMATKLGTVLAAIDQSTWELHVVLTEAGPGANMSINAAYAWQCNDADIDEMLFNRRFIEARSAMIKCSFPRYPIPILGPF